MSAELKDFRGEITDVTDVWLQTQERVYGRTRQSVVRELLHAHALRELDEARVLVELAGAHGVLPAQAGAPPEDGGVSRRPRR